MFEKCLKTDSYSPSYYLPIHKGKCARLKYHGKDKTKGFKDFFTRNRYSCINYQFVILTNSFYFSFGIIPTMEKLYHQGVMRTELDDCQFVCITQSDYYKILNDREENQKIVKDENGHVVLVSEFDGSIKNGKLLSL